MRTFHLALTTGAALLVAAGAAAQTPAKAALAAAKVTPSHAPIRRTAKKSADFVAVLGGGYETPAVTTDASGSAEFVVRGPDLHYIVHVKGLTDITGAHLHLGAANTNGSPVATLYSGPARGAGTIAEGMLRAKDLHGTTMPALLAALRKGDAYVNVHTRDHPDGAIRGQVELQH